MKKIVYIISPEHSGSTALDLLLSTLPGYIGFGEITHAFNRIVTNTVLRPCSCGADAKSCPVWSKIGEQGDLENTSLADRYGVFETVIDEMFGDSASIIDSSKRLDTLHALHARYGTRLKVIFLTRDVRNYLASRIHKPTMRLLHAQQSLGFIMKRLPVWLAELLNWIRRNGRIAAFLRRNKIEHLRIGYDELGMDQQHIARIILEFLEEPGGTLDFSYKASTHHMLQGNKFFIYGDRQGGFAYSDSWKSYRFPFLCSLALSLIQRINRSLVYPNTLARKQP